MSSGAYYDEDDDAEDDVQRQQEAAEALRQRRRRNITTLVILAVGLGGALLIFYLARSAAKKSEASAAAAQEKLDRLIAASGERTGWSADGESFKFDVDNPPVGVKAPEGFSNYYAGRWYEDTPLSIADDQLQPDPNLKYGDYKYIDIHPSTPGLRDDMWNHPGKYPGQYWVETPPNGPKQSDVEFVRGMFMPRCKDASFWSNGGFVVGGTSQTEDQLSSISGYVKRSSDQCRRLMVPAREIDLVANMGLTNCGGDCPGFENNDLVRRQCKKHNDHLRGVGTLGTKQTRGIVEFDKKTSWELKVDPARTDGWCHDVEVDFRYTSGRENKATAQEGPEHAHYPYLNPGVSRDIYGHELWRSSVDGRYRFCGVPGMVRAGGNTDMCIAACGKHTIPFDPYYSVCQRLGIAAKSQEIDIDTIPGRPKRKAEKEAEEKEAAAARAAAATS